MDLKEKRKKVIQFLAKHCYDVAEDLNNLKGTDTIAGFSKRDFCDEVDSMINEIDNYKYPFVKIEGNEFAEYEMDLDEGGWTTKDDHHNPKWLKNYLKQNSVNTECIAYAKTLRLLVSKDFNFQYVYCYEIYDSEMEEDFLIKRWYEEIKKQYEPMSELDEMFETFCDRDE